MSEIKTCCGRVYSRDYIDVVGHLCGNNAKFERNGKHYCKTHDPVSIAERRKAKEEKWDADWKAKKERAEAPFKKIKELEAAIAEKDKRIAELEKTMQNIYEVPHDPVIERMVSDAMQTKEGGEWATTP